MIPQRDVLVDGPPGGRDRSGDVLLALNLGAQMSWQITGVVGTLFWVATTLKVVSDGAGSSRMLQIRGPMMVRGDYSKPTMKLDVWQKDMRIIDDFAREAGCPAPLFRTTAPIYTAALADGRGSEDTGAVCAVLEKMAKYRRPRRAPVKG